MANDNVAVMRETMLDEEYVLMIRSSISRYITIRNIDMFLSRNIAYGADGYFNLFDSFHNFDESELFNKSHS